MIHIDAFDEDELGSEIDSIRDSQYGIDGDVRNKIDEYKDRISKLSKYDSIDKKYELISSFVAYLYKAKTAIYLAKIDALKRKTGKKRTQK